MVNKELKDEILDLVLDITENEPEKKIKKGVKTNFIQGMDVDSLMALEIVAALEKKYKIEIREDDLPKLGSLDKMVEMVDNYLKKKSPAGVKKARKGKGKPINKPLKKREVSAKRKQIRKRKKNK